MANIVRGFRRIGWVVTVPVGALFVLVFFESTKEFSASNYEVSSQYDYGDLEIKSPAASVEERVIDMPDLGYASFSKEVPLAESSHANNPGVCTHSVHGKTL